MSDSDQATLAAVLRGARALVGPEPFEVVARQLFDACRLATGAAAGYVALLDETRTRNEVLFLEAGDRECAVDPEAEMPTRGLRAEAYERGRPVYDNDFTASAHAALLPEGHVVMDNVLFAPLVTDGEPQGLLGLANKPGGFTGEDAELAMGFADLAASALHGRRTLDRLRRAQRRAETYWDAAQAILVILEVDGTVRRINRKGCEVLGCDEDEVVGRNWYDDFAADEVDTSLRSRVEENPSPASVGEFEYHESAVRTRDGSSRLIGWHDVVVPGDGEQRAMLCSGVDITERVRAERAVARLNDQLEERVARRTRELQVLADFAQKIGYIIRHEELFHTLLEHLQDALPHDVAAGVLHRDGRCDIYLKPARRLADAAHEEVQDQLLESFLRLGRGATDSTTSGSLPAIRTHVIGEEADAAEGPPIERLRSSFKVPIVGTDSGDIAGLLYIGAEAEGAFSEHDVRLLYTLAGQAAVSLQRMRARIAAEQRRLEGLVDSLPDGVLLLDGEGRVLLANPVARRMLLTFARIGVGDVLGEFGGQPILAQLSGRLRAYRTRMTLDGTPERVFEMDVQPLGRGTEEGGGWVLVLRDVTQQHTMLTTELTRRQEMDALYSLSRELAEAVGPDVVLTRTALHVAESVGVTLCRVLGRAGDEIVCRAGYAIRPLARPLGIGRTESPAMARLCRKVLAGHQSVVFVHDREDLDDAQRQGLMLDLCRSVCLVPMRVGDEALGLLMLGELRGNTREPFGADKIRLAESIADQAAGALQRTQLHAELEQAYLQTALALANAMDARDSYTGDHSERTSEWAEAIARRLGCSDRQIDDVRWGAQLHDIGKIGVPDEVLLKPGKLDDAEWAVMKRHPVIGSEIVAPLRSMAEVAAIIRGHHERYDGRGYPDGLRGEEIPLGARIITVVDAFSAMTDDRVYRKALPRDVAIAELHECAGDQFDPEVVEAFLGVLQDEGSPESAEPQATSPSP